MLQDLDAIRSLWGLHARLLIGCEELPCICIVLESLFLKIWRSLRIPYLLRRIGSISTFVATRGWPPRSIASSIVPISARDSAPVQFMMAACLQISAFCSPLDESEPRAAGNPACAVLLSAFPPSATLGAFAQKMALPATVYLVPATSLPVASLSESAEPQLPSWRARFFTGRGLELPLCGHASLAAAHALWSSGAIPPALTTAQLLLAAAGAPPVRLRRVSGGSAATSMYEVRLVAQLPIAPLLTPPPPSALHAALGLPLPPTVEAAETGTAAAVVAARTLVGDVVIRMTSSAMAAAAPDAAALDGLFPGARIVSITACASCDTGAPATGFCAGASPATWLARADVVSRCFARGLEDPVCAAAHAGLAPYWASAPDAPTSLTTGGTLRAFQSSTLGGELRADIDRDASGVPQWVRLTGACATTIEGSLTEEALAELFAASA